MENNEWKDALEAKIIENKREKAIAEEREEEIEKILEEKRDLEKTLSRFTQEKRQLVSENETFSVNLKEKDVKIQDLERKLEKFAIEKREILDLQRKVLQFFFPLFIFFLFF